MIIDLLFVIISGVGTYLLSNRFNAGAIRSSALITLLFIVFLSILSQFIEMDHTYYTKLIFGASFVGMSSSRRLSLPGVMSSSVIFYFIFLFLSPVISYEAGVLGFCAFLGVFICSQSTVWLSRPSRDP